LNISDDSERELKIIKSFAIDKESQQQYLRIREEFNNNPNPYQFFALVSSCTNNMMRFNKSFKFNQSFGKRTINDSTIQKLKDYIEVIKDKDITFVCGDYKSLFIKYPPTTDDFIYLDPPYLISEAGYNAYWSKKMEEELYDLLDDLDSKNIRFVMSNLSQHKGVQNPYLHRISKYNIIPLEFDYEKVARKKGGVSTEIIIKNF
jgi:site-specific DNA-adenine methylase